MDNSLIWNELQVTADDMATEKSEGATEILANLSGCASRSHGGLHARNEMRQLVELLGIEERLINFFSARGENNFLVNGISSVRNFVLLFLRSGECDARQADARSDLQRELTAGEDHKFRS
ncbi:MAG: hypothetical protein AUG89_05495 [Acidobacteria bacterium 13_1_20CM_4_56_7]|nr:MAG: hypothetical protein AUG89_05495 [Acidobacteria bacterium 13_1_20CM_4_56_7]